MWGRLRCQRRSKRRENRSEKGAVPTVFKWSSDKRSRSTLASKGKRKGKAFDAPRKKRQRKSCEHCELRQALVDKLESDLEEKNAQLKELSKRLEDFEKDKREHEDAGALKEHKHVCFSAENVRNQDQSIRFYTGIVNWTVFMELFNFIFARCKNTGMKYWRSDIDNDKNNQHDKPDQPRQGRPRSLSMLDELFLTLVRLRHAFPEEHLAYLFKVSRSTVSRILLSWINLLYFESPALCPLTALDISQSVPVISDLYTGSISDKDITKQSGILELLEKGDDCMADKGFNIKDLLDPIEVTLNIPSFLSDKGQFDEEEVENTQSVASVRIHEERAISRIKMYKIITNVVPLSLADKFINLSSHLLGSSAAYCLKRGQSDEERNLLTAPERTRWESHALHPAERRQGDGQNPLQFQPAPPARQHRDRPRDRACPPRRREPPQGTPNATAARVPCRLTPQQAPQRPRRGTRNARRTARGPQQVAQRRGEEGGADDVGGGEDDTAPSSLEADLTRRGEEGCDSGGMITLGPHSPKKTGEKGVEDGAREDEKKMWPLIWGRRL
ncbi:hypothetical protein ACROYT_G037543 [Oculina patagonica]